MVSAIATVESRKLSDPSKRTKFEISFDLRWPRTATKCDDAPSAKVPKRCKANAGRRDVLLEASRER